MWIKYVILIIINKIISENNIIKVHIIGIIWGIKEYFFKGKIFLNWQFNVFILN